MSICGIMLMLFQKACFRSCLFRLMAVSRRRLHTILYKKFLQPSGKHISCFGKSSWVDTNNLNCFQPWNVGNIDGYQDWSNIWKVSRVCSFYVQQVFYQELNTTPRAGEIKLKQQNIMMQRTANENAACLRRICKRSDQPKIERLVKWCKADTALKA